MMTDPSRPAFVPPPERCDAHIQYHSRQPTIWIKDDRVGSRRYLVYIGHKLGAHHENDVLWAYLVGRESQLHLRLHQGPSGGILGFDQFFVRLTENHSYGLAAWLEPFIVYSDSSLKSTPSKMTSSEAQPVIKDAVLATLDECAGYEIHTKSQPPCWLHDVNKAEPSMIRGLKPWYWTPQPITPGVDHGPFCYDFPDEANDLPMRDWTSKKIPAQQITSSKGSNRDPGVAKSASSFGGGGIGYSKVTKKQRISAKKNTNQPVSARSEIKPSSISDQQSITGHNTDLSESNKNADITSTNNCHHQQHKNISSSSVGLSNSCKDSSTEVNAHPVKAVRDNIEKNHAVENSTELHSSNARAVLQPFAADFERLLVRPVKKNAAIKIAEHLQMWRDGWIDLDGFESRMEASLSDARLSIRMQKALVQSDPKAPIINMAQKNDAVKKGEKRRRSQSDGPSAAVQSNAKTARDFYAPL